MTPNDWWTDRSCCQRKQQLVKQGIWKTHDNSNIVVIQSVLKSKSNTMLSGSQLSGPQTSVICAVIKYSFIKLLFTRAELIKNFRVSSFHFSEHLCSKRRSMSQNLKKILSWQSNLYLMYCTLPRLHCVWWGMTNNLAARSFTSLQVKWLSTLSKQGPCFKSWLYRIWAKKTNSTLGCTCCYWIWHTSLLHWALITKKLKHCSILP